MDTIKKYFRVWLQMTLIATQVSLSSRFGAVVFILGKILRFVFFLFFLVLLESRIETVVGYTLWQVILFFLTFNLIDTTSQLFLREVYRFRRYIVTGDFDYILVKPISPLFRSLFGGVDILDVPLLFLLLIFLFVTIGNIGEVTFSGLLLYFLLVANGLLIVLAFHIFVLGVAIMTTEVDNAIMVYRDISQMGRIPVDIYRQPLQWIITFIVPVGIMMTFPAKALLGILSFQYMMIAFVLSTVTIGLSLFFWRYALRYYTSASS